MRNVKKKKRKKKIKSLVGEIEDIIYGLNNLVSDEFRSDLEFAREVNFYTLQRMEIGASFTVDDSVSIVLDKGNTWIDFYTTLAPNRSFPRHWHNNVEDIFIIRGELYEETTKIAYTTGDSLRYDFGFAHTPANRTDKVTHILVRHFLREPKHPLTKYVEDLIHDKGIFADLMKN